MTTLQTAAQHLIDRKTPGWVNTEPTARSIEMLRDALAAEVVRLDAGWHDANGDTLDKALELDKVKAAAKLALEVCLDMRRYGDQRGVALAIGAEAVLRKAGVQ